MNASIGVTDPHLRPPAGVIIIEEESHIRALRMRKAARRLHKGGKPVDRKVHRRTGRRKGEKRQKWLRGGPR